MNNAKSTLPASLPATADAAFEAAASALKTSGIETLETRLADSLDFHDLAVWNIHAIIKEAFTAGHAAGIEEAGKRAAPSTPRTSHAGHAA